MDPFINDNADIFYRMIQNWKNQNNFCSIGKVIAVNASPISVNIQPLIKYYDNITRWEDYPVLLNVPVIQMATSLYSLQTPLNPGDTGIILWVDREIYTSLLQGATTSIIPDSGDLNDQNACIFLPILQSFALAKTLQTNGVDIISSGQSLLTQLLNLLSTLSSLTTDLEVFATAVAAAPTTDLSTYAAAVAAASTALNTSLLTVASSLTAVTTALTTFKGAQA